MQSFIEALLGDCATERDEIDKLATNIWARNKWAQLTNLQRLRIEIGAAADTAGRHKFSCNVEATLRFWCEDELFAGITLTEREGGTLCVSDGKEEFLAHDDGRGINISSVCAVGMATLEDPPETPEFFAAGSGERH